MQTRTSDPRYVTDRDLVALPFLLMLSLFQDLRMHLQLHNDPRPVSRSTLYQWPVRVKITYHGQQSFKHGDVSYHGLGSATEQNSMPLDHRSRSREPKFLGGVHVQENDHDNDEASHPKLLSRSRSQFLETLDHEPECLLTDGKYPSSISTNRKYRQKRVATH